MEDTLTKQDYQFIESALQAYWFDAHTNLTERPKELGDLEKEMLIKRKKLAKSIIEKIEPLT